MGQRGQRGLRQKTIHEAVDTVTVVVTLAEVLGRVDVIQEETTPRTEAHIGQHVGMRSGQAHRLPRAEVGDQWRELLAFNDLMMGHAGAQVGQQSRGVEHPGQLLAGVLRGFRRRFS
jgi:hypothetical protein